MCGGSCDAWEYFWKCECGLVDVSFVYGLYLVGLTEGERGIGIFGISERISWFLIETSSGYTGTKYLEYIVSYGSLVPEDTSRIRDRERVVGERVGACGDDRYIKGLRDVRNISDSSGVTGFRGVSSY